MMSSEEPPFIKYEEILVPAETDQEPGPSRQEESPIASSSSEDEEMVESMDDSGLDSPDSRDKANAMRADTISKLLDSIFQPKEIMKNGKKYLLRLSREPSSRQDIVNLGNLFQSYIRERQVRNRGYCPIRRELYDTLFDELIRQSTIVCPERGALLLRVRDELRMTVAAYEKLYESGVEYGSRKSLEAENEKRCVDNQYSQLKAEVERAEKKIKDMEAQINAEQNLSKERIEISQLRHQEKMEFLKQTNKQLKEQLSYI